MIYIHQNRIPKAFVEWKAANHGLNCNYKSLPGDIKSSIKDSLLQEQKFLCAYTMIRIKDETSHIEHIEPQSAADEKDLDYSNMAACFPGSSTGMIDFGAKKKDDCSESILSPHDATADAAFEYKNNGIIVGRTDLAKRTIEILNLNHPDLIRRRKSVYDDFICLLQTRKDLITAGKASLTLKKMQENDRLPDQFGVMRQILLKTIEHLSKRSKRLSRSKNTRQ